MHPVRREKDQILSFTKNMRKNQRNLVKGVLLLNKGKLPQTKEQVVLIKSKFHCHRERRFLLSFNKRQLERIRVDKERLGSNKPRLKMSKSQESLKGRDLLRGEHGIEKQETDLMESLLPLQPKSQAHSRSKLGKLPLDQVSLVKLLEGIFLLISRNPYLRNSCPVKRRKFFLNGEPNKIKNHLLWPKKSLSRTSTQPLGRLLLNSSYLNRNEPNYQQ